jgi:hypothetical protein
MEAGEVKEQKENLAFMDEMMKKEAALGRLEEKNAMNVAKQVEKQKKTDEKTYEDKINAIDYQGNYMMNSISMVAKASKASAGVQKGIDIAQATANTALAVSKNLATPWMIPFIIAMGGAQVALIAQQKYAGGGLVGGGNPSQGDIVPAMLTPGEMVLNGQQQSNLFNQLNRPNVSNSNAVNLNISVGNGGTYDMNAARYTVDQLVPIIGDALIRAKSQGRLRDYENAR